MAILCLRTLDEVARTKSSIVITKRGRPVAKLVPCGPAPTGRGLVGSVLEEVGDPFGTHESWDADAS
jgi:antitoxin (DNA-binding transcriptional repressor) of toxin-antitoxin stability system